MWPIDAQRLRLVCSATSLRALEDLLEVALRETLALGDHAEAVGARGLGGLGVLEDLLGLEHRVHRRLRLGVARLGAEAAVLGAPTRLGVDQRAHVGRVAEVLLPHLPGPLDEVADLLVIGQLAQRESFFKGDQRAHDRGREVRPCGGRPPKIGWVSARVKRRRIAVLLVASGAFAAGVAAGRGPTTAAAERRRPADRHAARRAAVRRRVHRHRAPGGGAADDPRGAAGGRDPVRGQPALALSRAAADPPAAGDPAAAPPARSAARDGRSGGRAREAGRRGALGVGGGDGPPRPDVQPPPGSPHRREPPRPRVQRRPCSGARCRPPGRRDRGDRPGLRRHGPRGDAVRRRLRQRIAPRRRGGDRQALPGDGRGR